MRGLSWALQDKVSAPACQTLKWTERPEQGSVTCAIQMVSISPYSLKTASLEQLPLWERGGEGRVHIPRMGKE